MYWFQRISKVFLFCLISQTTFSQLSFEGKPWASTTSLPPLQKMVSYPEPDIDALWAEDEQQKGLPLRFGIERPLAMNFMLEAQWDTISSMCRVGRLQLESSGAFSLNLIFNEFRLPRESAMYIYTPDMSYILGRFDIRNVSEHGKFSTTVLPGSSLVIELSMPLEAESEASLSIEYLIHGYKNIFFKRQDKNFGTAQACNVNVNCPEGDAYVELINASLLYLLSNNTRVCSGTMVNNVRQDGRPYFLSANHCFSNDWSTWIFMFNYQSPACSPSQDGPVNRTISGSTLRARFGASDFMLFELSSPPPPHWNVYLAGWSNIDTPPTRTVCIHHPGGDVKKFSIDLQASESSGYYANGNTHWRVNHWELGSTQGGSSGSGLFDQNRRLVGQLHGGDASCGNNLEDYFGKIARSWNGGGANTNRLRNWLDPDNTGTQVLNGRYLHPIPYLLEAEISIVNPTTNRCPGPVTMDIQLTNLGEEMIQSASIAIERPGFLVDTISWNGNLSFSRSVIITTPSIFLSSGSYPFTIRLLKVNGKDDSISNNNLDSATLNIVDGDQIRIDLFTDNYGNETSIRIVDTQNNQTIYTQSGFNSNTSYQLRPCLPYGCYRFEILDRANDGICCSYGNGNIRVSNNTGETILNGSRFQSILTANFCIQNFGFNGFFEADSRAVCPLDTVSFSPQSFSVYYSHQWFFENGTPSTSTNLLPKVLFEGDTVPTYHAVQLVVTDIRNGIADTVIAPNFIQVKPTAVILWENTQILQPTESSLGEILLDLRGANPQDIQWDHGPRGAFINNLSPGVYNMQVTAPSGCILKQSFGIFSTNTKDRSTLKSKWIMFPNPSIAGQKTHLFREGDDPAGLLRIYDVHGKRISEIHVFQGQRGVELPEMDICGVFWIEWMDPEKREIFRWIRLGNP